MLDFTGINSRNRYYNSQTRTCTYAYADDLATVRTRTCDPAYPGWNPTTLTPTTWGPWAVTGNFWLNEYRAPTGYNIIRPWMPVVVAGPNAAQTTVRGSRLSGETIVNSGDPRDIRVVGHAESNTVHINVYNDRGWILPETGAAGTIALTVVGVGLLGGALVLFVGNKKEKDSDEHVA
jgi:LPXTG-motif cell wall-anchored protein